LLTQRRPRTYGPSGKPGGMITWSTIIPPTQFPEPVEQSRAIHMYTCRIIGRQTYRQAAGRRLCSDYCAVLTLAHNIRRVVAARSAYPSTLHRPARRVELAAGVPRAVGSVACSVRSSFAAGVRSGDVRNRIARPCRACLPDVNHMTRSSQCKHHTVRSALNS
jgi:hypothetical protein